MSGSTQKGEVTGAVVSGGLGGTSLVLLAKGFPAPWSTLTECAAPGLAAMWAICWPPLLHHVKTRYERWLWVQDRDSARDAIVELLNAAKARSATLQNQAAKDSLSQRIDDLENALVLIETAVPLSYPWQSYVAPIPMQQKPA
jgi:hypothetical protein